LSHPWRGRTGQHGPSLTRPVVLDAVPARRKRLGTGAGTSPVSVESAASVELCADQGSDWGPTDAMAPPVAQALTTDRKIEKGEKESFRHLKCFVAAVTPRRRHMTVTSESPHLPPLGGHARTEVGRELEATLLELIDLSLLAKQLHWSLSGPLVPVLHRHLDELIESWRELADKAAERAIAIGYWPDGQADAVAARDEHAAVARAQLNIKPWCRCPCSSWPR
jgi:hypothetical protein